MWKVWFLSLLLLLVGVGSVTAQTYPIAPFQVQYTIAPGMGLVFDCYPQRPAQTMPLMLYLPLDDTRAVYTCALVSVYLGPQLVTGAPWLPPVAAVVQVELELKPAGTFRAECQPYAGEHTNWIIYANRPRGVTPYGCSSFKEYAGD